MTHGAEGVVVIPPALCSFCSGGSFFQAIEDFGAVYQYPPTDFASLGGNILVTSDYGAGTAVITFDGTNYNLRFFDNIGGKYEGSSWADCDVRTPTTMPIATPTATATATATPTPTPTAPSNQFCSCSPAPPPGYPSLGVAAQFTVFAINSPNVSQSANLGLTTITGDVAASAGVNMTFQGPSTVNGNVYVDLGRKVHQKRERGPGCLHPEPVGYGPTGCNQCQCKRSRAGAQLYCFQQHHHQYHDHRRIRAKRG